MIKKVQKVWGSEEWIVNNERYCGKILNLKKGFQSSLHHHKNKHETFYILKGKVLIEVEGNEKIMNAGDVQLLEPNTKHRFTPLVDSKIIEFSTHHDDKDTYRDIESQKVDVEKIKENLRLKNVN
ncbi:cupin domain-containing protein [Candidatus Pacearchaeota archaeon]|nr:cupin domain-containing protein [Candidatus Pacearchaeota archaeon]